jgi:hypothetical protein
VSDGYGKHDILSLTGGSGLTILCRDTRPGGITIDEAEVEKKMRFLGQCDRARPLYILASHRRAMTDH